MRCGTSQQRGRALNTQGQSGGGGVSEGGRVGEGVWAGCAMLVLGAGVGTARAALCRTAGSGSWDGGERLSNDVCQTRGVWEELKGLNED